MNDGMDNEDRGAHDPHSSFNLSITLSIGYQRKRARLAGKWEASITSIALLAGGIAIVAIFVWTILRELSML